MTESPTMATHLAECGVNLVQRVEDHLRLTTHGRIRGLAVKEEQGRVVIHGQVASHHTRQLALHAALELLATDQFRTCITVA